MTEKSKGNKKLIVGICAAVVAVVLIIVAIVLATSGGINDSYFVSDDAKYVLSVDGEAMPMGENSEYTPVKMHQVYEYKDDAITGLKVYFEYADADAAKAALDYLKDSDEIEYETIEQNGKYVVITAKASEYENLTASDVKQQVELLESLQNAENASENNEEVEESGEESVDESSEMEEAEE